ncbi:agmatinase family protein [Hirschia baltica]|uniref:Arginase/agmatinase/formiminoglutamase n=1 Tax=Hirschia baltica (strain ATCC 49814 / DSM 5838 / IFAM 1418) TaxID=582402 RepID=C6XQ99_HIRBI|nr:agmatinase family protein [Hirschia baltica]ACT60398.1 Arginase/agmatinase/formiminoglutamase [Hirschia baltica ATCC 49814]
MGLKKVLLGGAFMAMAVSLTPAFISVNAQSAPAEAVEAEAEETPTPEWLEKKIKKLPDEKKEFLLSDKSLRFVGGTKEKLYQRLEKKTGKEIEAMVDAMQYVIEEGKFDPETDLAAIPMNTEATNYNGWKVMKPKELNPKREPGPFTVSRYANSRGGIATFAGAPIAMYPDDLIAGNVDVAIVGAPLDMGSYYRGQKFGPMAMRNSYATGARIDMNTMVNPSKELNIVDYGDIAIDNMSTELSVLHVRERIKEIAETGTIPFIVGGDHSLEYPDIAGLADVHGKASFGVVHFDSHFDAGKDSPHFLSHGQPVYRAVKEGHVLGENYIQVGLRGGWPGPEGFEWMRNNGVRYHTMPEVEKKGWDAVMKQALAEAREDGKKLFISFDVDVLDPAFIPGTGTPVPGGLTMREAIPIVRGLCAENDMVGFELVELAPEQDPTYRSALNANFIMQACLTGIAMRKKGITDGSYLSELTTEHMQPEAGIKAKAEGLNEEIDPNYGQMR